MTQNREHDVCALCGRPLGTRRERHHLVPRRFGGRETVWLHPICHRRIHSLFDDRTLARRFADIAALRAEPAIATFIRWLAGKPPDFHRRTEPDRRRGAPRRRGRAARRC